MRNTDIRNWKEEKEKRTWNAFRQIARKGRNLSVCSSLSRSTCARVWDCADFSLQLLLWVPSTVETAFGGTFGVPVQGGESCSLGLLTAESKPIYLFKIKIYHLLKQWRNPVKNNEFLELMASSCEVRALLIQEASSTNIHSGLKNTEALYWARSLRVPFRVDTHFMQACLGRVPKA